MKFIFSSFDRACLDLDWRLPIVIELIDKGHTVTVFLPNIYKSTVISPNISLLQDSKVKIVYRNELINITYFLVKIINYFSLPMHNLFIKIFLKLDNFLLKQLFFKNRAKTKILDLLTTNDVVISGNYPGIPIDFVEYHFYKIAKESNIFFVGTPIVALSNWSQREIYPFDLFLISSTSESANAEKLHHNVKFFGCPSFELSYKANSLNKNNSINFNNENKVVLIILVNNDNAFFQDLNQVNETNNIIRTLLDHDYNVVVKSHPRTNYIIKYLVGLGDRVVFVNDPIDDLSKEVDFVISFTSSTIYKAIANKCQTVHFVPQNFFKSPSLRKKINDVARDMYYKNLDSDDMWLDQFCPRVGNTIDLMRVLQNYSNVDFENFHINFVNVFKPQNASCNIVKFILKVV